jgi:hypothetical protein
MTNKQLYNLVLENYIQAKKELIREGYLKREESNKIDFNEIFDRTKGEIQKKKIEKLQRENQMLREKLSQRRGLEEAGVSNPTGYGEFGHKGLDSTFGFMGNLFRNPTDRLNTVSSKIFNIKKGTLDFDELEGKLYDFIKSGKLNSSEKIEKAIRLVQKLDKLRPSNYESVLTDGIEAISQPTSQTLAENRRRRRY